MEARQQNIQISPWEDLIAFCDIRSPLSVEGVEQLWLRSIALFTFVFAWEL